MIETKMDRREMFGFGLAALVAPLMVGCDRKDSTFVYDSHIPGTQYENTFQAFGGDVVIRGFANSNASTHHFEISIAKPGHYSLGHPSVTKGGAISGVSELQAYEVTEGGKSASFQPIRPWANGNYMQVIRYTELQGIETDVVCIQYAARNP